MNRRVISTILIATSLIPLFIAFDMSIPSADACQTNAKGCIEQGGPGASVNAPAEASGCHFFPSVSDCARTSTPPHVP